MNNQDSGKDAPEKSPDDPEKSGSFLSGGSFFHDIKLALLAGAAFASFQWGGELMDRLEKWIDGESHAPAMVETPARPMVDAIDGDIIKVAGFSLNIHDSWVIEPMTGNSRRYGYFQHFLNPGEENSGKDRAFLTGTPESYLIEFPDKAGQIILFRTHVLINRQMTSEDFDLIVKSGAERLVTDSPSTGSTTKGRPTPLTFDENTPFYFNGSVDPATISENDIIDHYFLDLLSTLHSTRVNRGPVELRHLRRASTAGYEIGEIEYVFASGTRRLNAVFYWHQTEGAQWGEFGLFLTMRMEPVSRKHQKMYKTISSLRLMDGAQEIWRGLNYDAPADTKIGAFVHVDIDARKLQAYGLDVDHVESKVQAQPPVSMEGLEVTVIVERSNGSSVLLKDIANVHPSPLGDENMLRTPASVVLTVSQ